MDMLDCEWGSCEEKFPSSEFHDFREHIEGHLREVLPQYRRGFSEDTIPDNFACSWRECGWDSPIDAGDLIRHVFFHAFHTRIKLEGFKKQQEMKLSPCTLDSQSRNLIPDNTEPFLCQWKECSVEFNCPTLFYRHVDSHALAVDKSLFEARDDGRRKYAVTCQWEGKPEKSPVRIKLKRTPSCWLSLLLGDSRYIEKKLSECTRKNDEFHSLPKMTNSINCTKFRNN